MRNRSSLIVVLAVPIAVIAVAARPPSTSSQPSTLLVTVVDSGARYPLTNAEVIDVVTGRHRFTDERGQTRVSWPGDGKLRVRVREIGYQPLERTLDRASSAREVVIELSRVAYVISPVRSTSHCSVEADSASRVVSADALRQLQQSAEKYEQFRHTYA